MMPNPLTGRKSNGYIKGKDSLDPLNKPLEQMAQRD